MEQEIIIQKKFFQLQPFLNEKQIRLYAASESMAIGYSGISIVSRATGISRRAITEGCKEINTPIKDEEVYRVRHQGAGRKKITKIDKKIKESLEQLIEPATRGDPESPLKWTSKSLRNLSDALHSEGHIVSHQTVASLLSSMGYSLQANKKVIEGGNNPDRNAQFEYINNKVKEYQKLAQPVI